jgi:predicted ATPase with chaperone activity
VATRGAVHAPLAHVSACEVNPLTLCKSKRELSLHSVLETQTTLYMHHHVHQCRSLAEKCGIMNSLSHLASEDTKMPEVAVPAVDDADLDKYFHDIEGAVQAKAQYIIATTTWHDIS